MGLSNVTGPPGPSGMNFRGVWTATPSNPSTYNLRDGVRRPNVSTPQNGGTFLCLANGITSDPLIDTTNWVMVAADGAQGPQGNLTIGLDGTHAAAGNDSRLMEPDPPVINGFIATTLRPREASSSTRPGTGTLILTRLWLPSPATISNIYFILNATGSGNQTGFFAGLYSSTGSLVASSADQHTYINANNTAGALWTIPLSSSYSWSGGANAYFYIAYLAIGGTTLPAVQASGSNTNVVNANVASGAQQGLQIGSQSSLPASLTMTSLSVLSVAMWAAVS